MKYFSIVSNLGKGVPGNKDKLLFDQATWCSLGNSVVMKVLTEAHRLLNAFPGQVVKQINP